jgi:hypothetical protein
MSRQSPDDADLGARVREVLERTDIMALATIGPDGSWISPVRYSYNERLELFFLPLEDSKHAANIRRDPRVSVAIYSFRGPSGGSLGLQLDRCGARADRRRYPDRPRRAGNPAYVALLQIHS